MGSKKLAALFTIFLILASLLSTSCSTKASSAQVQPPTTAGASLIVIDSSGNALPIVFGFSREVNGVKYYLSDGKELTHNEICNSLKAQGITVAEVDNIWGTSIAAVFALFTPAQLYERPVDGSATNAALLYDMWQCLTTGPPEIRDNPRGTLEGLIQNIDMRNKVFDFLEQRRQSALQHPNTTNLPHNY